MENSHNTVEHKEMAAVKKSYQTDTADHIDWCVSQIDCVYQWQFVNHFPMILNDYPALS
jgi:uncharacterized protein YycO